MGIQALLRAARDVGSRCGVVRVMIDLARHQGISAGGTEELTPVEGDIRSLIPLAAVAAVLLAKPSFWERLSATTVNAYAAATPRIVQFVRTGE